MATNSDLDVTFALLSIFNLEETIRFERNRDKLLSLHAKCQLSTAVPCLKTKKIEEQTHQT